MPLGNWEQIPIKRKQLLLSMFSILWTVRHLFHDVSHHVTILPSHFFYQLLCLTSSDFNHKLWF